MQIFELPLFYKRDIWTRKSERIRASEVEKECFEARAGWEKAEQNRINNSKELEFRSATEAKAKEEVHATDQSAAIQIQNEAVRL